ncbi:molybdate ABC transporter permease subunit [Vibrio profundum]|uniref:molybdate ABC transporter permease subunit n=1 Tax=Vibrio profundum TaxID=2910247 RepID=UPI003D1015D8
MMLSTYEYQAIELSLKVAIYTVLWLLPAGVLLGWLLARHQFIGKRFLDSVVHLPLVLPPVVVGYLLLLTFGRASPLGGWLYQHMGLVFSFNWKGAVLASSVVALPLMVRSIRLAVESVDQDLEQAAATLGAGKMKVFYTITLPLILPGILTGSMLSFARSLGEFGATMTFVSNIPGVTQTIPLAMYNYIQTPGEEMQAASLCLISVSIALLSLLVSDWLAKRARRRLGVRTP